MKRRNFLKMCGLLPLGGSLAAVAASGAENKSPGTLTVEDVRRARDILQTSEGSGALVIVTYPDGYTEMIPYREFCKDGFTAIEISQRYPLGTKCKMPDGRVLTYVHKVKAMT